MTSVDWAEMWIPTLPPWEVALRASIIYVFVQVVFRVAGRKELGRWGLPEVALFFLVATSVRTSIVASDHSLTSGMVGLVTIVALDRIVSTVTARSPRAADWLEGPVRRLVENGAFREGAMRKARVSRQELEARAREQGRASLDDLRDAYLERSGKVTLIFRD